MAKLSEYLSGSKGTPSAARLCAFTGLMSSSICSLIALISWVFAENAPNWAIVGICITPGVVGILPLIFQYVHRITESGKLENILKVIKEQEVEDSEK